MRLQLFLALQPRPLAHNESEARAGSLDDGHEELWEARSLLKVRLIDVTVLEASPTRPEESADLSMSVLPPDDDRYACTTDAVETPYTVNFSAGCICLTIVKLLMTLVQPASSSTRRFLDFAIQQLIRSHSLPER